MESVQQEMESPARRGRVAGTVGSARPHPPVDQHPDDHDARVSGIVQALFEACTLEDPDLRPLIRELRTELNQHAYVRLQVSRDWVAFDGTRIVVEGSNPKRVLQALHRDGICGLVFKDHSGSVQHALSMLGL